MILAAQNSILSLASKSLWKENSYVRILRPYKEAEDSSPKYISKNLYVQENKEDSILNSVSITSLTSK